MRVRGWRNGVLWLILTGVVVAACGDDDDAAPPQGAAGEAGQGPENAAGQAAQPGEGGDAGHGGTGGISGSGSLGGQAGAGDGATAGVPATGGAAAGVDSGGAAGAGGEGPEVDPCATIEAALATHVAAMRTEGWQAQNVQNGMTMFGCSGATTARDCLGTYPRALGTAYGAGWETDTPASVLRVLRVNAYSTSFATAVSADGRFVGHGGKGTANGGATLIDLQGSKLIGASASYDPNFWPDGAGFMLQGGDGKACRQSLLTSSPTLISFNEPECAALLGVGLYNHVAALPNGGDYVSVHGNFVSDNGGHQATLENPSPSFSDNSKLNVVPFLYDGSKYAAKAAVSVPTPNEGDFTVSPSGRLVLSRPEGAASTQDGYNLRKLTLTPSGNTYTAEAPIIAHYCATGGIPSFSYDERFIAYHRYVTATDALELGFTGAADPSFAEYLTKGAANLYLMDLLTGVSHRITRMAPGQYALYPSFRSDGWLYFIVRVADTTTEYVVASDAALPE